MGFSIMFYEKGNINIPDSILSIEVVDDKIYILDNKFNLFIYANDTFSLIEKHSLLNSKEDKYLVEKTACISKNLDFYHSLTKSNSGVTFNINNNKVQQNDLIELNEKNVSYCQFSPDSKLLLVGGEDGKVYFYSIKLKRSLFSLKARPDYISCSSFSNNNKLVCIGAYDNEIVIYDIDKQKLISKVAISDTIEDIVFTNNDDYIIGITRDKKIFSYDIKSKILKYVDMEFEEWPTSLECIGNNHIIVGTKGDNLYLFSISDLMLLQKFQTNNLSVNTFKIYENNLYIAYTNGELKIVDIDFLHSEFELHIKTANYTEATELIEKNIFLITKEIAKEYDVAWPETLEQAKKLLFDKDIEEAKILVEPFFWDSKKREEFTFLQLNVNDHKLFEDLIQRDKDVLAFKLADDKEYLKTTKSYKAIEKNFNKVWRNAKNLFSQETKESELNAKKLISPYLVIKSKEKMINNLFLNHKAFVRSYKLAKARNFKLYFILLSKNEFLKNEDIYEKILEIGNQIYNQLLHNAQQANSYDKAIEIAKYLQDFTPFYEKAMTVQKKLEVKIDFENLIEEKDILKIYDKVSEFDYLELSTIFIEFHKNFESIKAKAITLASNGESQKVKYIFADYERIKYLKNSIASVFKLSYLVEMEMIPQPLSSTINVESTTKKYVSLFGLDDEIKQLSNKLNFSNILKDIKSSKADFATKEFYESIVVNVA